MVAAFRDSAFAILGLGLRVIRAKGTTTAKATRTAENYQDQGITRRSDNFVARENHQGT